MKHPELTGLLDSSISRFPCKTVECRGLTGRSNLLVAVWRGKTTDNRFFSLRLRIW